MGSVQDREPIDVAIVGGGIGGLALAIGLQQHGHIRIKIYEAASKFSEIGAGVFFGANSIRAMSLIHPSVGEAYARISTSVGWESKKDTYFDFILAHELHGLSTGTPIISPKLSATERHSTAHRAHFVDELIKLIPKSMAEFGKRLTEISRDETREKTVMSFADGSTAEADAVIGCDGIKSVCREFVLGKDNPLSQPVFTGKHAYRGLIPMDKATAAIGEEKAQNRYMFIGKGGHVLTFPIANGSVMNVVAFSTTKSGTWEGEWTKRMKREDLATDFEGFGKECQKIFSLMESTDHWGIFDLSPDIPTYQSRDLRLLLLGDSAHACAPHQGAGAGQALEDAYILSRVLGVCRYPADLFAAFTAYETVRMPRAKFVQYHGRRQGELLDLQRSDVGDDLEKLKAVIDVPIREIWNCDLSAELEKALAVMKAEMERAVVTPPSTALSGV
ncbi:FAD/NAD(P)-binding domain-containing protein [Trichoderma novae-zelandiae]